MRGNARRRPTKPLRRQAGAARPQENGKTLGWVLSTAIAQDKLYPEDNM
jgi:hypothetical protein